MPREAFDLVFLKSLSQLLPQATGTGNEWDPVPVETLTHTRTFTSVSND